MNEDFKYLKALKEKRKQEFDVKYKENSKKRLLNNIEKKFKTTIIGSLAVFEQLFGDLWGHGLNVQDLNDDQKYWRKVWLEARSKILDNGNSNLRASQGEIAQYTLTWDRYVTELHVVQPGNKE